MNLLPSASTTASTASMSEPPYDSAARSAQRLNSSVRGTTCSSSESNNACGCSAAPAADLQVCAAELRLPPAACEHLRGATQVRRARVTSFKACAAQAAMPLRDEPSCTPCSAALSSARAGRAPLPRTCARVTSTSPSSLHPTAHTQPHCVSRLNACVVAVQREYSGCIVQAFGCRDLGFAHARVRVGN